MGLLALFQRPRLRPNGVGYKVNTHTNCAVQDELRLALSS